MRSKLALRVRQRDTLAAAWRIIRDNARTSQSEETKAEIEQFAADADRRLRRIADRLQKGTFEFPPARGVAIPKGKNDYRPLVIARVEARVVQRAIHDVLVTLPSIQRYVHTPYSFGGVRKAEGSEIAAVPAAISAVLEQIRRGAQCVIRSDIEKFFTRISKSKVTAVIEDAVMDGEFMSLFKKAIAVELSNLADLREKASRFPIHDIGVAQGNSLSPLLGNILLYEFDDRMNMGDCACIRYIDDFVILAPHGRAAAARFRLAERMLSQLGMKVLEEKSRRSHIRDGIEFLGVELVNGLIRPSSESRSRLLKKIRSTLDEGMKALRAPRDGAAFPKSRSLVSTLHKVDGIISGWAKHYWFCNDGKCLEHLDERISELIGGFIGTYREERSKASRLDSRRLLGVQLLGDIERKPFKWYGKVAEGAG